MKALLAATALFASTFASARTASFVSVQEGYKFEVSVNVQSDQPATQELQRGLSCWRNDDCETGDAPPTPYYQLVMGPIGSIKFTLTAPNGKSIGQTSALQFSMLQRTANFTEVGLLQVRDYFTLPGKNNCSVFAYFEGRFPVEASGNGFVLSQSVESRLLASSVHWTKLGEKCAVISEPVVLPLLKK